jgi:leader peptidase (prepilin peptidase) / N-methyltransferase
VIIDTAWFALGGAIAGLIAGSFISTLVIRWPLGLNLGGRSVCEGCGRGLAFRDLVPLLSCALAKGKCRICGAVINWRHPAIEVVAVMIGALAMVMQPGLEGMAGALFGWQLLALAALDAEHFWLPDTLTGALALSGLIAGAIDIGIDLPSRIIGGIAGYGVLFAIAWTYRRVRKREGIGGGDPKLLGAIGCWLGWQVLPYVLVAASVVGVLAALGMLARGNDVSATTRLPLGTLMAGSAFLLWLLFSQI